MRVKALSSKTRRQRAHVAVAPPFSYDAVQAHASSASCFCFLLRWSRPVFLVHGRAALRACLISSAVDTFGCM